MRTIRTVYRLFRAIAMLYTAVRALQSSRWLLAGVALWRLFRKRPEKPLVADIAFVDGSDPVLYRRTGWRRIVPKRSPIP